MILLRAACTTRRLTVAIGAAAHTRVLADTGTATRRAITLRGGAGLLTLAPSSPLRSLTVIHGSRTTRVRIDAPPGARQCGWLSAVPLP